MYFATTLNTWDFRSMKVKTSLTQKDNYARIFNLTIVSRFLFLQSTNTVEKVIERAFNVYICSLAYDLKVEERRSLYICFSFREAKVAMVLS